jgi:hypothetical protein
VTWGALVRPVVNHLLSNSKTPKGPSLTECYNAVARGTSVQSHDEKMDNALDLYRKDWALREASKPDVNELTSDMQQMLDLEGVE